MQFKSIYYFASIKNNIEYINTADSFHLSDTIDGAKYFMKINNISNYYIYQVAIYTVLHPLFIDEDIQCWEAQNLSQLLLAKIQNNQSISDYNLESIRFDAFIPSDENILKNLTAYNDFQLLGKFLSLKGFNCIIYPLFDIDGLNSECCIIWDTSLLKSISLISKEG